MKSSPLVRYALSCCVAAAVLAACGGSQPPGAKPQSPTIATHAERSAVPSYLYIADASTQRPAIIAFDAAGNKVAEKRFKSGGPVDVVTDSRGHVYADVFNKEFASSVFEYTHGLDRTIAEYHPPGFTTTMAVDAADNLYVQSESGLQQSILRYRYGSTRVDHTYHIVESTPGVTTMLGISIRANTLYTLIAFNGFSFPTLLRQCDIKGAGQRCYVDYDGPEYPFCGFTTADQDFVYAPAVYAYDEIGYNPIGKGYTTQGHTMRLPQGYGFKSNCIFHSYGAYAWVTLVSASEPAEAAEIDLHRGVVKRTIGAGYLVAPQAAYYGNGFRP